MIKGKKLIKYRGKNKERETPSSTVQLPVKIRPLLRKFQVGLRPHVPPSPTGPIIEYAVHTHMHTQTQHIQSNWSPVVRQRWWRVLDGIISPAVPSPVEKWGPFGPKKLKSSLKYFFFPHADKSRPAFAGKFCSLQSNGKSQKSTLSGPLCLNKRLGSSVPVLFFKTASERLMGKVRFTYSWCK